MVGSDTYKRREKTGGENWPAAATRLIGAALLALAATTPFAIQTIYQRLSFSQTYFVKMAGLSLTVFALAVIVAMRLPLRRPSAIFGCYLAYLAVVLLSIAARAVPGYGLAEAILPLTGAGILFVLEVLPAQRRWQQSALLVFAAVGCLAAVYGILQNFGVELIKMAELETERQVLVSFFGHSNFMASFLGPTVFLAAYFLGSEFPNRLRAFAAVTIAACVLCFFWAGTRAAALAAVVAALSLLRWRWPRPLTDRRRFVALVAIVALGVSAAILWGQYGGRHRETLLRRLLSHRELSSRLFFWMVAAEMIRDHPLLGIGYGRYNAEFWPYAERLMQRPDSAPFSFVLREMKGLNPGQAHNDLIEVACETGALGTSLFIALWVAAFAHAGRVARRGPPPDQRLARHLRAALIFVMVDAQFGFPLQLPASALVFWFLLGIAAQTAHRMADQAARRKPAPRRARPYHAPLLLAIPLLVAALLWVGREMQERSRFNRARLTPTKDTTDPDSYIAPLEKAAAAFPYDGSLYMELARQTFAQARRLENDFLQNPRLSLLRLSIERFEKARLYNQRVFETYFDVEAYKQLAWTEMKLHVYKRLDKREAESKRHLQAAASGFERVVLLNPGDVEAHVRRAYIQSDIATQSRRPEDWERLKQLARRILDEQHDNTNGFYFLGMAFDNTNARDRAVNYYFRAITHPTTMPDEKRMGWTPDDLKAYLMKLGSL